MTGNSPSSTPITPFPDPPASPGEAQPADPIRPLIPHREETKPPGPETSSDDDLGLLLSEPDPFLSDETGDGVKATPPGRGQDAGTRLVPPGPEPPVDFLAVPRDPAEPRPYIDGGEPAASLSSLSSENELVLPVTISPSPDLVTRSTSASTEVTSLVSPRREEPETDDSPRTSWPHLLVTSYASAVTLALIWVLWTGQGLLPPSSLSKSSAEARLLESSRGGPVRLEKSAPPLPGRNVAALGTAKHVGDVEVTPQIVTRRPVDVVRLDGATGETRQVEGVLVLSLRLTNRSPDQPLSPLEPAFVRDSSQADDQSFIETADGRRISMLRLATESEWAISDQTFPRLIPGEGADTIVVSEPVQPADLAGTLTWHVKLRTGTYQTDVLGVQFTAADVRD